jgi:hypothetical protein
MSGAAKDIADHLQQAGQSAKEQDSAASGQAKQAAGDVVDTAADQAREVADQARDQAGNVMEGLRERVTEQAEAQAQRAAGSLRQWADDLAGLAQNAPGDSPARSLTAETADRGHRAADYLDKNGVGGLVEDLQGFARRRPGAFLGGAALAGLCVGRLAKAGKAAQGRPGSGESEARRELPGPPEV